MPRDGRQSVDFGGDRVIAWLEHFGQGHGLSRSDVRRFDQLPEEARSYIARLCELIGAQISLVSIGPARDQIVAINQLF